MFIIIVVILEVINFFIWACDVWLKVNFYPRPNVLESIIFWLFWTGLIYFTIHGIFSCAGWL